MNKRTVSLLLTLSLLLSLCLGLAATASATEFDGGDGSRDRPYLISTAEQLKAFRDLINDGNRSLCGALVANIDLGLEDWDPIGLSSAGYTGVFDGNGYAIRNLMIGKVSTGTSSGDSTLYGGGLFGIVGSNGVVRGVNVDGKLSSEATISVPPDIGAIAGGNVGTIEECFATITCDDYQARVTGGSSSGRFNLGGVVGINNGTVRNCYTVGSFDVDITLPSGMVLNIGGVVGRCGNAGAVVENCYSAVSIDAVCNRDVSEGSVVGYIHSRGTYQNLHGNQDLFGTLVGSGESYLGSACTMESTSAMKTESFARTMGSAFAPDDNNENQGYPVLSVMAYGETRKTSDWFQELIQRDGTTYADFEDIIPPELWNRDLQQPISRMEFCSIAVRLYENMGGEPLRAADLEDSPFTDSSVDVVRKAVTLGITNGITETTFCPYNSITREQAATMLTRMYSTLRGEPIDKSARTGFADDAQISGYASGSVKFMSDNGIVEGRGGNMFAPQGNITVEEALTISLRMYQKFQ